MSITESFLIDCDCGARVETLCCQSLNAERHPELRDALLERKLHQFECAACGKILAVEKKLAYIDLGRRQFYSVATERDRKDERALIQDALAAWELAFGKHAPVSVGTLFATHEFQVRLCFGLEELREKVIAKEAGIDDLALEILKGELLASHPELANQAVRTMRLDHVEPDGKLAFVFERGTEPPTILDVGLLADRRRYDELAATPWRELVDAHPGIAWGPHVSLLRLAPSA